MLKVAFELHHAGRHPEAEVACRVLMRFNPRDGRLLFLPGMEVQQTGRSQEALKLLEQAAAVAEMDLVIAVENLNGSNRFGV